MILFYHIGTLFSLFCSGGWTLVYNLVLQTSNTFSFALEKNWKSISNYTTGKIVLTADALGDLMRKMPFQQLRFHCFKKNPGRTFHVVTNKNTLGRNVVKYFTAQTDVVPKSCHSFHPVFDDNSELSPNCSQNGRKEVQIGLVPMTVVTHV